MQTRAKLHCWHPHPFGSLGGNWGTKIDRVASEPLSRLKHRRQESFRPR